LFSSVKEKKNTFRWCIWLKEMKHLGSKCITAWADPPAWIRLNIAI